VIIFDLVAHGLARSRVRSAAAGGGFFGPAPPADEAAARSLFFFCLAELLNILLAANFTSLVLNVGGWFTSTEKEMVALF